MHKSTITREFQRNSDQRPKIRFFFARRAQKKVEARQKARRTPYRFSDETKEKAKTFLEEQQMSPEQIVGYCRKHGIDMVSHETLCQWILADKKAGGRLHTNLRYRGRRHHKRGLSRKRRGVIPNRIDISDRPKVVDRRTRFGEFEIDTIAGATRKQHILTINDKTCGRLWMRRLVVPTAGMAASMIIDALGPLAEALGATVYFARPYYSWELGSNENTNGLIRQYIPKGADFDELTPEDILEIQEKNITDRGSVWHSRALMIYL